MRLIDADKLMADDTFCEGIECDMCSLSYIDDVYHCRACGVTKWIINQPTVCDIEQIRTEITHLLNRPSLTHVVGYDKGFVDGIDKVLQIIDKYR